METSEALAAYLEGLRVPQGVRAGDPFRVLDWQRRVLRLFDSPGDVAASVSRRNGKSTLTAALAAATLDGPLHFPGADNVIAASSFAQGAVVFRFVRRLLGDRLADRKVWRVQDSQNVASIERRETGARLMVVGNNPARAHGLAVGLAVCDEMAQWDAGKRDRMLNVLRTSAGTVPGSRLVAIGTRPADPFHPFEKMLTGARGVSFAAAEDDDPMDPATWRKANPSIGEPEFAALREVVAREAKAAAADPLLLAGFRALRLNMGQSEALAAVLLEAEDWRRIEAGETPAARDGPWVLGVDLSGGGAMSAFAAYWWRSGNLEAFAGFPELPSLEARGLSDGVGGLYVDMRLRGELVQLGRRVPDVTALLREAARRWGYPFAVVADYHNQRALRQSLEEARYPRRVRFVRRGMGWKEGGEDVRMFRRACLSGEVTPRRSLLLRSAMREARVVADSAGRLKFAKSSQGGRRQLARDDAAAAAILSVADGSRRAARAERRRKVAVVG